MNILITGAAQGIGAAIAKALANSLNTLILVDLNEEKLNASVSELKSLCKDVVSFTGDLSNQEFIQSLRTYISDANIDVLVNNAGVVHKLDSFEKLSVTDLDLAYKVNVRAPFELIQAVLPSMQVRSSGMILNIASRANVYGYSNMGVYASSKAALTSFSGTVAIENPHLKAITIVPGRTNTQMQATLRGALEASKAQSPEFVGKTIAQVITGDIAVNNGGIVIIDFGEYSIETELDKIDLHKNMH